MKRVIISIAVISFVVPAFAGMGVASTDRFGYAGTVTRYATLADAESQSNATDTVNVSDRDLSLYIDSDYNIAMGSWWYTTDPSGNAGWGNTTGNTGVGFMQLYDTDASTTVTKDMSFSNFDGTYWTEFNLSLTGANAGAAEYARMSVYDNVNDGGIWHDYALNFTATGLEGVQLSPGVIESTNHPTGVSGSFTGLFELTENQTSPANIGFYVVNFTLNTDNWAYDNAGNLTGQYAFADSYFKTVPVPGSVLLGVMGLALAFRRSRA